MKQLPKPKLTGIISVEEAIAQRRSIRSFASGTIKDEDLSQLLFAAQGITDSVRGFRSAPSAGATYPLQTYAVTAEAIYRYEPKGHVLTRLKQGDFRKSLSQAALGQQFIAEAPLNIVFCAITERTTFRYGKRGIMYIYMEAGHAAQNIHLQAVSLGLGSVPVGAFDDSAVAKLLDVDNNKEIPLYIISVGKPQ